MTIEEVDGIVRQVFREAGMMHRGCLQRTFVSIMICDWKSWTMI